MKFPLPANTIPRIELSDADEAAIAATAEELVKQTVAQYHEHLTRFKGVVDEYRWKQVKRREDVRVYRERRSSTDDESNDFSASVSRATSSSGSSVDDDNAGGASSNNSSLMLMFGTIPGCLNDVMYGVLSPTADDMLLKSAYLEDNYLHCSVLASIMRPTPESPFRDMSVKWAVRGHPLLLGPFTRKRDAVYVESVGYAQTPNGECIGYQANYSVDLPGARELLDLNFVRAKVQYCSVFRQRTPKTVEVYSRGFIQPNGSAPLYLGVAMSADIAVSMARTVHCSEMKKLTRLLRLTRREVPGLNASNATTSSNFSASNSSSSKSSTASKSASAASESSSAVNKCALCSERIGGVISSLGGSSKGKRCRMCDRRVCSRCRVFKDVYSRVEFEELIRPVSMAFCTHCVLVANRASAAKFAEYDALERQGEPVSRSMILDDVLPWWSFVVVV
uniref:FYVE-type domain-containing protein n=1 Tax=Globisporangium ultimum (strain ATCC 200006 / CBS 805.95 / DAOM BR144) TaxID=431595 RepID=K3W6C2_GLOUD